jgi:mannose-6-phosphate isomerase-like protein (cupin superfamily)
MKLSILLIFLLLSLASVAQENWKPLFNGKDLTGWKIRGGEASYKVEGETIVGTTKGRYNTFLSTARDYSDFILELELFVDPAMNSGIQIRSHESERVLGYQIEVDPAARAWSGGIYDESRRGWLYPLTYNPKGQKAFKNGIWNKYRIEAIGNSIRVWVNGVFTSALLDDKDASGFIALQVHGIGDEETPGKQIKWRNVKILTEGLEKAAWGLPENEFELNMMEKDISPLFVDAEEGKTWNVFGLKIIGKILSEDTDGAYAVIVSHAPANGGPPLHVHENEEEVFYVLEGSFEFTYGNNKVTADKGDMVVLPKNLPHSFKNIGNTIGITMNTMTPGGLEKFFDEIAAISKNGPPDPKRVSEIAMKYKMRFLTN